MYALETGPLLSDSFHRLVPMGVVHIFIGAAEVMEQAEVDQDLLILLREPIAGIVVIDEGQQQDPENVADTVNAERVTAVLIAQCPGQDGIPEKVRQTGHQKRGDGGFH